MAPPNGFAEMGNTFDRTIDSPTTERISDRPTGQIASRHKRPRKPMYNATLAASETRERQNSPSTATKFSSLTLRLRGKRETRDRSDG
jgi:hypothetical protein